MAIRGSLDEKGERKKHISGGKENEEMGGGNYEECSQVLQHAVVAVVVVVVLVMVGLAGKGRKHSAEMQERVGHQVVVRTNYSVKDGKLIRRMRKVVRWPGGAEWDKERGVGYGSGGRERMKTKDSEGV